jgi:hypothetical protein
MKRKIFPFLLVVLALALSGGPARAAVEGAQEATVAPCDHERKYVVAEAKVAGDGPFRAKDKETGAVLPAQGDGETVRWLIPSIAAGAKKAYVIEKGAAENAAALKVEDVNGSVSIKGPDREITRFHPVAGTANKKPCFYPLTAHGTNILRGYPLEDRAGEAKDHPHHTGVYFAFGEVNGKEYWSKTAIENKSVKKEAGPVYARIRSENHWGQDLVEIQDVLVLNAGPDALLDFTITLTAANGPVVFGKDLKMAKEGAFSVRVATGLTDNAKKDPGMNLMVDSKGNKGEAAIRADNAPWVDYVGTVDGKKVGVSVMNHPSSFRYPTDWHVRAYGLFAANPWIRKGENTLEKGQSLTLRYRVYVHAGDTAEGKVAAVNAGFANAKVE